MMKQAAVEKQLAEFVGKYTPEIATSIQACRKRLHTIFPRGYELVYDNYNALVFAFGPSQTASEVVLSLAAYPRWVTLFFANGTALSDPTSLLQGSGTRIRGITLATPEQINSASVMALITRAIAPVKVEFAKAPALSSIVKSVSTKQRARRPVVSKTVATKKSRQRK